MKTKLKYLLLIILSSVLLTACVPQIDKQAEVIQSQTLPPSCTENCETSQVMMVEPVPTATQSATELARGQQVVFWHGYSTHALPWIEQYIEDFNQMNEYGITVEARGFLSDEQLQNAFVSSEPNELPQVVLADSSLLINLDDHHLLVGLSPYTNNDQTGLMNTAILESSKNFTRGGNLFALPAHREGIFLLYNNTWARELGFYAAPASLGDWELQAAAAFNANIFHSNKALRGTGGWLFDGSPEVVLSWMGFPSGSNSWDYFTDPEAVATFARMKTWQDEGFAWNGKNTDPAGYFIDRQALFVTVSSREMPEFLSHLRVLEMPDEWSIIPFPLPEGRVTIGNDYGYAILSNDPGHQMASWIFIQWLLDSQKQARLADAEFALPILPVVQTDWLLTAGYPRLAEGMIPALAGYGLYPGGSSWPIFRQIMRDAIRQVMLPQTLIEDLPGILDTMDQLFQEYGK